MEQGSILDDSCISSLGQFDVVYSWGVLHHTGDMWRTIGNSFKLVKPGGTLLISLYAKGPRHDDDRALNRRYNAAGEFGKRIMVRKRIARIMLARARHLQDPLKWNRKVGRGMDVYRDILDWLGGLPYEAASHDEVVRFSRQHGFVLERIRVVPEEGCSKFVFSLSADAGA